MSKFLRKFLVLIIFVIDQTRPRQIYQSDKQQQSLQDWQSFRVHWVLFTRYTTTSRLMRGCWWSWSLFVIMVPVFRSEESYLAEGRDCRKTVHWLPAIEHRLCSAEDIKRHITMGLSGWSSQGRLNGDPNRTWNEICNKRRSQFKTLKELLSVSGDTRVLQRIRRKQWLVAPAYLPRTPTTWPRQTDAINQLIFASGN